MVNIKKIMYDLISPFWILLTCDARCERCNDNPLGPSVSVQVRSSVWVAILWAKARLVLGAKRCTKGGKNPSMLENR